MPTSEAVTRSIRVSVESRYDPDHSDPKQREWFFAYHVCIKNDGQEKVQLLNRHWIITDATGGTEEVRGAGVVGRQPVLGPGESFEYTSFCPLGTPFGSMRGSYQLATEQGEMFDVEIASFALCEPGSVE